MRICIPTTDDTGLSAKVHAGFGDAPWFTLIDPDAGTVLSVPNDSAPRSRGASGDSGPCATARRLELRPGDALMCQRLGLRAFRTLSERGIFVFRTTGDVVSGALTAIREAKVLPLHEDEVGCGHDHDDGHGHGGGACCG